MYSENVESKTSCFSGAATVNVLFSGATSLHNLKVSCYFLRVMLITRIVISTLYETSERLRLNGRSSVQDNIHTRSAIFDPLKDFEQPAPYLAGSGVAYEKKDDEKDALSKPLLTSSMSSYSYNEV